MLVELYQRWLFEVWQDGDESAVDDLLAEDLIDHGPMPGQPPGRVVPDPGECRLATPGVAGGGPAGRPVAHAIMSARTAITAGRPDRSLIG